MTLTLDRVAKHWNSHLFSYNISKCTVKTTFSFIVFNQGAFYYTVFFFIRSIHKKYKVMSYGVVYVTVNMSLLLLVCLCFVWYLVYMDLLYSVTCELYFLIKDPLDGDNVQHHFCQLWKHRWQQIFSQASILWTVKYVLCY